VRLAVALLCYLATAAVAGAPSPTPYVDVERGFQVALPAGWQRVEQTTTAGAREPILKAANDRASQWLVVLLERGPTDEKPEVAQANLEEGFSRASGYRRLSIARKALDTGNKNRKTTLPAIDLWFTMRRGGEPVVVGVRSILYPSYVLTLVVDAPGRKAPDRATRRLLESFRPAPPDARTIQRPAPPPDNR
jgi:hypothetical protein